MALMVGDEKKWAVCLQSLPRRGSSKRTRRKRLITLLGSYKTLFPRHVKSEDIIFLLRDGAASMATSPVGGGRQMKSPASRWFTNTQTTDVSPRGFAITRLAKKGWIARTVVIEPVWLVSSCRDPCQAREQSRQLVSRRYLRKLAPS